MSTTPDKVASRHGVGWRWDVGLVVASVVVPGIVYSEVVARLFERWLKLDQAYSHGFIVAALSAWLSVRVLRAHRFAVRPAITGILLTLATSSAVALAGVVSVQIVEQMGLAFLLWTLIFASLGWRAAGHFLFPIGFLAFAIPFWDYLAFPLQKITTAVSGALLGLWDIRFSIEDHTFIHLQDIGIIEVANGCSGQRYLVIALTLAALFSYLNLRRMVSWAVLLGVAGLLALITNWIRVFVLVLVGYESVMTSPLLHEHELYGWLLFVVMLLPLGWLGNRLIHREESREEGAPQRAEPTGGQLRPGGASGLLLGLAIVALLAPVTLLQAMSLASNAGMQAPALPQALGTYQRQNASTSTSPIWQPTWKGADTVERATYRPDGGSTEEALQLGLWHYQSQRSGGELIQYGNHLVPSEQWRVVRSTSINNAALRGPGNLLTLQRQRGGERVALAYSYYVAGQWTTKETMAKLYRAWASLTGRQGAALLAATKPCSEACEPAGQAAVNALAEAQRIYE